MIDPATVPDCLEITAWSHDELDEPEAIMGVRHKQLTVEGVQFHPESIASHEGHELLRNFRSKRESGHDHSRGDRDVHAQSMIFILRR